MPCSANKGGQLFSEGKERSESGREKWEEEEEEEEAGRGGGVEKNFRWMLLKTKNEK